MKLFILLIATVLFMSSPMYAGDLSYFQFNRSKNYLEVKYYPPHNEWTPAPGAANVGVDRWALGANIEVDLVRLIDWALFAGGSAELHYMVDWPGEVESRYSGDLREVSARWHGGVRWRDTFEVRAFHGREIWYPSSREHSRYLFSGLGARMYFGK